MADQEALIDEIRQIAEQYRVEVPGRRKAWPEAIKKRALKLHDAGMTMKEVAERTGLSYFTVVGWNAERRRGVFQPVAVIGPSTPASKAASSASVATVAVTTAATPDGAIATVTLAIGRIRVKGVTPHFLAELVSAMGERP